MTANYPPIPAWKMVDANDAKIVQLGGLKISPMRAFAQLENGRADFADSASILRPGFLSQSFPGHAEEIENISARTGFTFTTMIGGTITQFVRGAFAFCMAEPGCRHDSSPGKPKVIFEIADADALTARILERYPNLFTGAHIKTVTYRPREFTSSGTWERPDPFVKDPSFACEREIRILFHGQPGVPEEPIFTEPDEVIASLLKVVDGVPG